ncbi:uncharacterized protein [Pyrus communis]|uniref:uncharacterized protein n=1 Tax=Pyrus communis TaxID=23211 RepID=UPI0035C0331F
MLDFWIGGLAGPHSNNINIVLNFITCPIRQLGLRVLDCSNVCMKDWVAQLAQVSSKQTFEMVLMLMWSIWRARNDLLWNGTRTPPREITVRDEEWLSVHHRWHLPCKEPRNLMKQRWSKPPEGWIKWKVGVATSPLHAEMAAARRAVMFVKERFAEGTKVLFESNYSITMAAMKHQGEDTSLLGPIIKDVQFFLHEFSYSQLNHVRREANHAAHRLAPAGLGCQMEIQWCVVPPELINNILVEDSSS